MQQLFLIGAIGVGAVVVASMFWPLALRAGQALQFRVWGRAQVREVRYRAELSVRRPYSGAPQEQQQQQQRRDSQTQD